MMDDAKLETLGAAIASDLPAAVTAHAVSHGHLVLTSTSAEIV